MRRLHAVTLLVPDYRPALNFYVHKLGFVLLQDIDLGDGKRWVRVAPPGGECALILARATTAEQKAVIGQQAGDRVSLFLETTDFAADHAAMLAEGVAFEEEPRQEPYGTVAVWRDPFGNRWDLIEFAENNRN